MKEVVLGGTVDLALSHFALVGLATIIAEQSPGVRLWWRDAAEPEPVLSCALTTTEIGEVVREHASRLSVEGSWLRATAGVNGDAAERSLVAPRAKAPEGESGWISYVAHRHHLVTGGLAPLDERFIEGLGEPAWWRVSSRESRPDDGASRWEMKTRNRGEEVVTHRLLPLAVECAQRSAVELAAGLVGDQVNDGTGKGDASRSATGLKPPGEVDSAVAWCALWALAHLPPTALRDGVSFTPGVAPPRRTHPTMAVLPVYSTPTTPARWGQIMRSESLAALMSGSDAALDDARSWLKQQGVGAVLRCRIEKGGSSSAPERWVLPGELERWE